MPTGMLVLFWKSTGGRREAAPPLVRPWYLLVFDGAGAGLPSHIWPLVKWSVLDSVKRVSQPKVPKAALGLTELILASNYRRKCVCF
jgi:hypothetical protein